MLYNCYEGEWEIFDIFVRTSGHLSSMFVVLIINAMVSIKPELNGKVQVVT